MKFYTKMNIIVGQLVQIRALNTKTSLTVINYLHQNGKIKGKKMINGHNQVPIVEFRDHTRIWILPEELKFI